MDTTAIRHTSVNVPTTATAVVASATDWLGDADDWGDEADGTVTNLDNANNVNNKCKREEDLDNGNSNVNHGGLSPGADSSSPDTTTPPSPLGAVGGFPGATPEKRNLNLCQTGG